MVAMFFPLAIKSSILSTPNAVNHGLEQLEFLYGKRPEQFLHIGRNGALKRQAFP
jgi:hypothetical protein